MILSGYCSDSFEANYSGINLSTDTETVELCTITE